MFDRGAYRSTVIYLVRDPRDVAISWARFTNRTIDAAIAMLADPAAMLGRAAGGISDHIPQRLGHWSAHVTSWIDESGLAPLVVRFEDMLADIEAVLARIATHIGWTVKPRRSGEPWRQPVSIGSPTRRRGEGFGETPESADRFFVSGKAGGWRDLLTAGQAARIERDHRQVMERLGYL